MGRPKKPAAAKDDDSADMNGGALMVQSRARRTIKPNPRYNSQEIIPLKRLNSGGETDDEDEVGPGSAEEDNTEDDEDFRDDGAKDSDPEDSPPARRRGRPPRTETPRTEPPPQRRLQQIRASMTNSKIMQHGSAAAAALEKKRKIEYDSDDLPETKRGRPSVVSASPATRVATRNNTNNNGTGATSEKENAKTNNAPVRVLNAEKASPVVVTRTVASTNAAGALARSSPRRGQPIVSTAATTTPSPLTVTPKIAVALRTNTPKTSVSPATTKETPPPTRSMIQVRRSTPMNTSTSSSTNNSPVPAAASTTSPVVVKKEPVILNRIPLAKTKPTLISPRATIKTTSATSPVVLPQLARPLTARSVNSTTPQATVKTSPAPATQTPPGSSRTLNKIVAAQTTTVKTSNSTIVIPKGAELEQMPDGTTAKVTTQETRYTVRVAPEEQDKEVAGIGIGGRPSLKLLELRNYIKKLRLPSSQWSYQLKLVRLAPGITSTEEVPTRPGYAIHSIVLNRARERPDEATTAPKEMDRSVELMKCRYVVNIEGKPVRLVNAPQEIADHEELETVLEILENVAVDSPVVRPASG